MSIRTRKSAPPPAGCSALVLSAAPVLAALVHAVEPRAGWAFIGGAAIFAVAVEAAAARDRRRHAGRLAECQAAARQAGPTASDPAVDAHRAKLEAAAEWLWLRYFGPRWTPWRRRFDAAAWVREAGPGGPRVIAVNIDLPPMAPLPDASEEAEMGLGRTLGPRERRWRIAQVIGAGVVFLLMTVVLVAGAASARAQSGAAPADGWAARLLPWAYAAGPLAMACVYGVHLARGLYRLGVRPVRIVTRSAAPGVVRSTRRGVEVQVRRETGVLVLHRVPVVGVAALAADASGRAVSMTFSGGADDPALRELVGRWCRRDAPRSRAA